MMPEPIRRKLLEEEEAPTSTVDRAIARVVRQEIERMNLVQRLCVDIDEISEMLGCSVSQVHNLITEGKLTNISYDRRVRCDVKEVIALVRKPKRKARKKIGGLR